MFMRKPPGDACLTAMSALTVVRGGARGGESSEAGERKLRFDAKRAEVRKKPSRPSIGFAVNGFPPCVLDIQNDSKKQGPESQGKNIKKRGSIILYAPPPAGN
jgi:hypothetical protein